MAPASDPTPTANHAATGAPTRDAPSPAGSIDPVHVVVLALCALALVAISWHYLAA